MLKKITAAIATISMIACNNNSIEKKPYQWPENIVAPKADVKPHTRVIHGDTVVDNYYWMYDFFGKVQIVPMW